MAREVDDATATMIRNLEGKTGKSVDQWLATARAAGIDKHAALVKHLKTEHGLTHGYANLVAHLARGYGEDSGDELIEAQYAGAKAGLRPIYEKVLAAVQAFGSDVEIAPKKTCVSFRRSKQFALAQPSTKTRVDLVADGVFDPVGDEEPTIAGVLAYIEAGFFCALEPVLYVHPRYGGPFPGGISTP